MDFLKKDIAAEVSRRTVSFYSNNRTALEVSSTSKPVQIIVNTESELIDFMNSRFIFKATATGGTAVELPKWGAGSFIREIKVKTMSGSTIGDVMTEYAGYQSMINRYTKNANSGSYHNELELSNGLAVGNNQVECAHKPLGHIFDLKTYFPSNLTGGLIIELVFAPVNEVYKGTAYPTKYIIEDLELYADLVKLNSQSMAQLQSAVSGPNGLVVDFSQPLSLQQSIASGDQGKNITMDSINGRIKNVKAFFMDNTNRNLDANGYWESFSYPNIEEYKFLYAQKPINNNVINVSSTVNAKQIYETMKSFEASYLDSNLVGTNIDTSVGGTNFVLGVKLDRGLNMLENQISSIGQSSRNDIRLELKKATTTNNQDAYIIAEVDKRMVISPGSVVQEVALV